MTRREVVAAGRRGAGDRRGVGSLTVHPQWRVRVGGVAAPALCDLRVLTARDVPLAAGLLGRAGCLGAVDRQRSGRSLVLLAWLDRERLAGLLAAAADTSGRGGPGRHDPAAGGSPEEQLDPRRPVAGRLWPAGCVEIRWDGPVDPGIGEHAGACVDVGGLYVEGAVRRHGVGQALVAAAEQHCLAAGQPRLVAALPPDAPGLPTLEQTLAIVARAGYGRLQGASSPAGTVWVWRDLPEGPSRR